MWLFFHFPNELDKNKFLISIGENDLKSGILEYEFKELFYRTLVLITIWKEINKLEKANEFSFLQFEIAACIRRFTEFVNRYKNNLQSKEYPFYNFETIKKYIEIMDSIDQKWVDYLKEFSTFLSYQYMHCGASDYSVRASKKNIKDAETKFFNNLVNHKFKENYRLIATKIITVPLLQKIFDEKELGNNIVVNLNEESTNGFFKVISMILGMKEIVIPYKDDSMLSLEDMSNKLDILIKNNKSNVPLNNLWQSYIDLENKLKELDKKEKNNNHFNQIGIYDYHQKKLNKSDFIVLLKKRIDEKVKLDSLIKLEKSNLKLNNLWKWYKLKSDKMDKQALEENDKMLF